MQDLVKNRTLLRLLFLLPAALIIVGVLEAFLGVSSWPAQAKTYLNWYRNQPLPVVEWMLNKVAILGLVGIVVSSAGLAFFWSPARYGYVACTLLAVCLGAFTTLPMLASPIELFIDDTSRLLVGLNIGIVFLSPASGYFVRDRRS